MLSDRLLSTLLLAAGLCLVGCGGGDESQTTAPSRGSSSAETPPAPDDVNHDPSPPADAQATPQPAPADAPEQLIAEITRLRTLPETIIEVSYEDDGARSETVRQPTEDEIAEEHRLRQEQIIDLAASAIEKTHADPAREQTFNNAVHYLGEARMQLALVGDRDQAQLLSQDAEALHRRDPDSFAAVETGYKVVQLAELMAGRFGADDPQWVTAFAQQARLFADRFPDEQGRAATSLINAGRMCEQFGLDDHARQCYLLVERQYPDSPYTQLIAGILRRLRLEGQPVELGGPTIDGGFITADDFQGRPLLVVFWASNSETFRRDLPILKQVTGAYGEDQLAVVGVSLDESESAVDAFLASEGIGWRQLFFSDVNRRGARNPVARYYGLQRVPTYWLIDRDGVVVAAPADVQDLPRRVAELTAE